MKNDKKNTGKNIGATSEETSNCNVLLSISLIFLLFTSMMLLLFVFHFGTPKASIIMNDNSIKKPQIDERKYRVIRLANQLEVMIVSDPNTSTCAASMAVGIGSFYDEDINGLAHFFEHMLFLGSKSYPSPTIFSNHLSKFYGATNAFTEDQKTVYYFDIAKGGFDEALLYFSRMFAEPLLDINYMNKEIDAVNSEHEKNINQDNWRQMELIKSLSNPNHPFSKFSTGSTKSLRGVDPEKLHNKILKFYDNYYTPSNMKLTVLGYQDIEVLQDLVTRIFSDIRKGLKAELNIATYGIIPSKESAFPKEKLGKIIWFKKLTSSLSLDFIFNVDELISKYRTKPENYFAYLMKYEGENSLVSLLKQKNYATKLETGILNYSTQFTQLTVSLTLTDLGLNNINEVIALTYYYISQIKSNGVKEEYFNEVRNINEIKFKFLEKMSGYGSYMSSLSGNMFDYEYGDLLYGEYRHTIFDEDLIIDLLNSLKIENCLIFIGSKESLDSKIQKELFSGSKEKSEYWYGTTFLERKITETDIKNIKINKEETRTLLLRPKNNFITKQNEVLSCDEKDKCFTSDQVIIPNLFYEDNSMKIFEKIDYSFKVPRTEFSLQFYLKSVKMSNRHYLITRIFFNYLRYELNTKLVEAIEAGNHFKMTLNDNGILFSVECYSDLTIQIFQIIIDLFYKLLFDVKTFNQIMELTSKQLKEYQTLPPYKKYHDYFDKMIKPNVTLYTEELPIINTIKYDSFKESIKDLRKEHFINGFFFGHVESNSLNQIKNILVNQTQSFNKESNQINSLDKYKSVYEINSNYIYRFNNDYISELNHFIANYYQIGIRDIKMHLITSLLELSWGKTFYHELRTVKQYGYIVNGSKRIIDNVMYYRIIVQGTKKTPDFIDSEIDRVIDLLKLKVFDIKENSLNEYKQSIKNKILKADDNLFERFSKLWNEIKMNTYEFDRKTKLLDELKNISVDDLKINFDDIFYKSPHKLSLQMYSGKYSIPPELFKMQSYKLNKDLTTKVTKNINEFHSSKFLKKIKKVVFAKIKSRLQ